MWSGRNAATLQASEATRSLSKFDLDAAQAPEPDGDGLFVVVVAFVEAIAHFLAGIAEESSS